MVIAVITPAITPSAKSWAFPRMTLLGSVKAGGLTLAQQQALADKCEFSLSWPEWNDPKADRNTKREARRDTSRRSRRGIWSITARRSPRAARRLQHRCCSRKTVWAETRQRANRACFAFAAHRPIRACGGRGDAGLRLELPQGFRRRSDDRRQARRSDISLRVRSHDRRQGIGRAIPAALNLMARSSRWEASIRMSQAGS